MMKMKLFLCLLLLNAVGFLSANEIPQFASQYTCKGKIWMPYAELDEPFTAYYDGKAGKSRIDYYDDLMVSVQRADIKQYYKLAYMVNTRGDSDRVCFNLQGSPLVPVNAQSIIPDLSNFKLENKGQCKTFYSKLSSSETCEAWVLTTEIGEKSNKYLFILKRDSQNEPIPLYYLMMGYNSLLGSHYDKYEIIYDSFKIGPIDPSVFEIQSKFQCRGFPGPGDDARALMNPMHEFIHGDSSHVDYNFNQFSKKHNKTYDTNFELNNRKTIFLHNYRFIASHNRKNRHYKLAVNHMADMTDDEIKRVKGYINSKPKFNGGLQMFFSRKDYVNIPTQWDWRLLGAVTPVKDQAICGSCWSFGSTGTLEGAYFVKTGKLLKLSQQQLIDCSWNELNNGCDGGEDFRSYEYIMKAGGIATEDDYGHYLGVDGKCHDRTTKKSVKISGFYNVTSNPEALKVAMYRYGPLSIAIDASQKTFTFYSHGVYYDPKCSSTDLDHSVLAVGYGELNNQKYWLVKNSWSTYWGNDGYILINQKDNDCGVMTAPTVPKIV